MTINEHFVEPFFNDVFSESKNPTEHQMAKYKLYQCRECHKWFSFLGSVYGGVK